MGTPEAPAAGETALLGALEISAEGATDWLSPPPRSLEAQPADTSVAVKQANQVSPRSDQGASGPICRFPEPVRVLVVPTLGLSETSG
jgi:hypothetical protein